MAKSFSDFQFGKERRWSDGLQAFEWDKNNWQRVRFFGPVYQDQKHRCETKTGKFYPEFCHAWDVENDKYFKDKEERCECCRLDLPAASRYFVNVIDLDEWENPPKKVKASWSPVYMMEMSYSLCMAIQDLVPLNNGKDVGHPVHGANILVKYDPTKPPANMYTATLELKDQPIPKELLDMTMTQEIDGQKKVLEPDLEAGIPAHFIYNRAISTRDKMEQSLRRNGYYDAKKKGGAVLDDEDESDEDEYEEKKPAAKKAAVVTSKVSSAAKAMQDAPVATMSSPKKAAKKPVDDDEDLDVDDDLDLGADLTDDDDDEA